LKKNRIANLIFIFIIIQLLSGFYLPANAQIKKNFYPISDSYVTNQYPENNYGNLDCLTVANYTDKVAYVFIMFDLSDIPNNAYIKSGTLTLQSIYIGRSREFALLVPNSVGAYKSENINWEETEINWNNKPECSEDNWLDSRPVNVPDDVDIWDISNGIRDNGTYLITTTGKLTIVLKAYHEETGFYSKESDYSPKLKIKYLERDPIIIIQIIVAVSVIAVVILVGYIYLRRRRKKK